VTAVELAVGINLEHGHGEACDEIADHLYGTLRRGYELCSVLPIPDTIEDWRDAHRTARKRADRCERRGYFAGALYRELHADDIYAINTSAERRQDRPMSAGYLERQEFSPLPRYDCGRHAIRTTGVFDAHGVCVAYLVMYRSGDLALVSQILGHDAHLKSEIMWLLFQTALEREIDHGPGMVVYNRHDSGTKGLRWWKEHVGLEETRVEWLP
jgi:hypothetical protein